jgi:hypothetical protein
MPSKSKIKGSTFEREISKFLSELYGKSFVRVVNSGAFVGGKNVIRRDSLSEHQIKSHKGDITPPDDWQNFNAEAKSYSDFSWHLLLSGEYKQLDDWLNQLLTAGEKGDINILLMKFNRKGRFVAVQTGYPWSKSNYFTYISEKYGKWFIMEWDSFWNTNAALVESIATGYKTKVVAKNGENELAG